MLFQGHSWIRLQGQWSLGQGVISPHISTSLALPGNLYLVPTAVGLRGGCGGLSPGSGVQLLQWEQQESLEGDRGCSAAHPHIPVTSCIPVFYPIMSLPQDNLPLGGVCHHRADFAPK